jgi:hypothetical protein
MRDINAAITDVVEAMIAGLCGKHVEGSEGLQFEVVALPDEMRREKFVRYSYGLIDQGGRIIPCG